MAAVGTMLYAAPANAQMVMVVNTATEVVHGVSTAHVQDGVTCAFGARSSQSHGVMWTGIVAAGQRLYAAPGNAEYLLVFDVEEGDCVWRRPRFARGTVTRNWEPLLR